MKPFLFITDLDNTLVGDDAAMTTLNQQLAAHRQQHGTKIVYSTGRSPSRYQALATEKSLLPPDWLVCAVGTEIYPGGSDRPDPTWAETLAQGWNRAAIVAAAAHFADLTPQPDSEQRPFKVSYLVTELAAAEVLPELQQVLDDRNLAVQVIYSGGKDLDILPQQANKGMAMGFIRQQLGFPPEETVACGDSGNDLALFADRSERGIIVGNAMPELLTWHHANPGGDRYLAQAHCAAGVLEGLQHFGFLP
jgi:sucrose-6F-phosphate phosphohydrolase